MLVDECYGLFIFSTIVMSDADFLRLLLGDEIIASSIFVLLVFLLLLHAGLSGEGVPPFRFILFRCGFWAYALRTWSRFVG